MSLKTTVQGASPVGVAPGDEAAASREVCEMFGRIAGRYDLLNHLLSGQLDRYWRRRLVQAVKPYLQRDGLRVADLCCGTGDVLISLLQAHQRLCPEISPAYFASDYCRPMLSGASSKLQQAGLPCMLLEADSIRMPLADGSLDLVTVSYGFRNLTNYQRGMEELLRLLAPGGCLAILEFSQPESRLWGRLFNFYFRNVLPRIGNALSGSGGAYSYLQQSVNQFLSPREVSELALEAGFDRVEHKSMVGGVSVLYLAYK